MAIRSVRRSGPPDPVGGRDPTYGALLDAARDEDWEPKRRSGKFVYFLHAPEIMRVKIGYSHDPGWRVRHGARKGLPREIGTELVGSIDGGRTTELLIHERFAEHRVAGEWFSDSILPDIIRLIEQDQEWFGEAA
jgi:hypothetical protein